MPSLLLTRPSPSLPPAAFLRAARRGLPPVINMVMSMILGLTLFACGQKQTDQTEQGQDAQRSYPLFHNRSLFVD